MTGFLRTVLAVVFAFMSLFHGPVMTFAKAASLPHPQAMDAGHGSRHHQRHHGAMPQEQQPADPAAMPVCNAFGCFVLVESPGVRLPAALFKALGAVSPGIAKTMLAADIEPAVPPPRLQV